MSQEVIRTSDLASTNLFKPLSLNETVHLTNRVVLPPLTRTRATPDGVPSDLMLQYYDERSKVPGTLITTEAVPICERAGGMARVPGIWNKTQVAGWKKITDQVHANGSYISIQLWNVGRQVNIGYITKKGIPFRSASDGFYTYPKQKAQAVALNNPLKALTVEEIQDYVKQYGVVAQYAVEAGFDFIELHGANGYLFDQFLQQTTNVRTDQYGGVLENRARFFLEVVDEIISKIGTEKLSFRLSPWATYAGMPGNNAKISPIAVYGYVISEVQRRADEHGGKIGYLSLVEPRVSNSIFDENIRQSAVGNNDFAYDIWKGIIVRSGNYVRDVPGLIRDVNKNNRTLISIGRHFISNPDLIKRLKNDLALTPYDRASFYTYDDWGYNSYPKYGEGVRESQEQARARHPQPLAKL